MNLLVPGSDARRRFCGAFDGTTEQPEHVAAMFGLELLVSKAQLTILLSCALLMLELRDVCVCA